MKKKCFFGILLSLFLLCGGVFLLASKNLNDQNVIEAAAVDITCKYNSAYGYAGKLGATIKMEHMLSEADGSGHDQDKKSYTLNGSTSLPVSQKTSHDNFPLRRGRKIWVLSVTYPSGLSNGRISINGNLYNLNVGTTLTYDVGFWNQDSPGNFSVNLYYNVFLTLDYNGGEAYNGTNSSIIYDTYDQRMELSDGTAKTTLALPKRDGYTFKGYYTSESNGIQVINKNGNWTNNWSRSTQVIPTTLYAQWEPISYNIGYNLNSGTYGENHPTSANFGNVVTISNPTRTDGYHFTGWTLTRYSSTAQSGTRRGLIFYRYTWYDYDGSPTTRLYFRNLQTTAGGTVTFTANWEINTYKVRFNANGGSGNNMSDQSFTYGTSQNLTKNSFTRAGHTFAGWNTKADGSGTPYSDSASVINLTTTNNATVTLYAQWQVNNLKANLNYMGGIVESSSPSQQYNKDGTYLSLPEKPSRIGYTFIGWNTKDDGSGKYYTSGTNFNDSTQVEAGHCVATANAGNIEFTLYAIWEVNDYKINYNLAGGSHGSSHPTTAKYDSVVNISNPTKKGYTFTGWTASGLSNTAKSGVSNSLSALKTWNGSATKNRYFANLTATDNNTVTLTANWTANTYTINYSLGDNTSFPATLGSKAPKSATYDISIEISTPTREGYVFAGWTLSGDDISTAQSGASTTSLSAWSGGANRNRYFKNLTPDASGSVTMTATWQATIASSSPSITATMPAKDSNNEYYLISNINNLAWLALQGDKVNVTGKFRQTNNIKIPNNILWLPIGRLGSFSGTYDGQGYTISGLRTYNGTDANGNYLEVNGGLFANAGGAKIKNVIIEDATIYGQNAGIIAGSGNEGTKISNCVVSGTVKGTNAGSIIGNGNGASIITACLAKGVNTASFAGGSASIDSCIYELNDPSKTRGRSSTFTKYSEWIYPSNFAYPMPKAFMWYPGAELSADSLNKWLGIA